MPKRAEPEWDVGAAWGLALLVLVLVIVLGAPLAVGDPLFEGVKELITWTTTVVDCNSQVITRIPGIVALHGGIWSLWGGESTEEKEDEDGGMDMDEEE